MSMLEPDHASLTRHRNVQLGRTLQLHEDRVAAFGAIRRAAQVARDWDMAAFAYNGRRPQHYDDCVFAARTTREAIRAAIGSEK